MTIGVYTPASYAANVGTTVFPIPWPYQATSHVKPYLDGVLLTTGFTISPAGASGTATFSPAPSGTTITFIREVPIDQPTDFQNQGSFKGKRHEDAYDREVMLSAQLDERLDRAVVAKVGAAGQVLPTPQNGYVLGWGSNTLINLQAAPTGVISSAMAPVVGAATLPLARAAMGPWGDALATSTGSTTARSLADRFTEVPNIVDYGGNGDGVTSNATPFSLVEAAPGGIVRLPRGVFYTPALAPTKTYRGEGSITVGSTKLPPTYGNIPVTTALQTSGADTWSGDNSRVNCELWNNNANRTRAPGYVDFPYFNASTTPYYSVYNNFAGNSGLQMAITVLVPIGASSVTVSTAAGLSPGQTIRLIGSNGSEIKTITTIVGSVVNFTPVTTLAYPTAFGWVSISDRTDNSFRYTEVNNNGGGDCYGNVFRIINNYTPAPGQLDFYATATCGIISGDVFGNKDGVYIQTSEVRLTDDAFGGPYDVAAISEVRTLSRHNDTGARGVLWIGNLYQSDGSKAVNSHMVATGKFLRGLDYGSPWIDFGTDQAAINLRANHRIYFNSPSTLDSYGRGLWGNAVGFDYLSHDGSKFNFNCANAGSTIVGMTVNATAFSVRGDSNLQGSVSFASGSVGGTTLLQTSATAGGNALPATAWRFLRVKIDNSGTWYKIPLYND